MQEYINHFGGKNGVLEYLYDYHPELHKHLVPMEILRPGQAVSKELFQTLKRRIKENNVYNILGRRSHKDDRYGMVDYLYTPSIPLHFIDDAASLESYVHDDERLIEKIGQKVYDETTVNLVPIVPSKVYTVTDNPNTEDGMFIDAWTVGAFSWMEQYEVVGKHVYEQWGFADAEPRIRSRQKNHISSIIEFVHSLRKLKLFNPSDKLQYELGLTQKDHIYLFQIKKFSDQFPLHPKEIREVLHQNPQMRLMGNLPQEGKVFRHIKWESLRDITKLAKKEKSDFVFSVNMATHANTQDPKTPHIKGLVTDIHTALYHNLTGPSQLVLKNKGFVSLGTWMRRIWSERREESGPFTFSYKQLLRQRN